MEWKRVPANCEYFVSDSGDVWDAVKRRIILPRPSGNGLQVFLRHPSRVVSPGRLVLEAFVGPCPDGMECCHWDDDQNNNVVSNLRWGTKSDNAMDRIRNGKYYDTKGEKNGMSRLTREQVIEARSLRKQDPRSWTWKALGMRYDVHKDTVRYAVKGTTWAHVETN